MTNRNVQQAPIGFTSLKLDRQRAFPEDFNPRERQLRRNGIPERGDQDWYADGYADGVRQTKERNHGAAWCALMCGLVGGTFGGLVWRELAAALVGGLSAVLG